jgi:cupin 2 domain-containing protein
MDTNNLFTAIQPGLIEEVFEELTAGQSFRFERIVSRGQSTPPGQWLEQDQAEWVVSL